ncbi:MAG: type II toxin-antitoxin system VapC family toxin [Chloroflexi bacterium]|nr:type II toxin-antitoxin system VapC family toxin [Chloroflexota bacterium]MBI4507446.1 type II toxin-antitoxin system VapC family toxin [Chloroflexota bacterium]
MIVVDASVLVSVLVPQYARHATSRRWLEGVASRGERLVAPALALAEIAGAIARRTGNPALAHRAVHHLLRVPGMRLVPVDRALGLRAAGLAADLRLRGADALYVAVAQRLGVPLATWDAEQLDRAEGTTVVRTPEGLS